MSDPKELFPFPVVEPGSDADLAGGGKPSPGSSPLPLFPSPAAKHEPIPGPEGHAGGEHLTSDEIRDLRRILEEYRSGALKRLPREEELPPAPVPLPFPGTALPISSLPTGSVSAPPEKGSALDETVLGILNQLSAHGPAEEEARNGLRLMLTGIADQQLLLTIWTAVGGVFPLRECLRHGTPDQRLFVLISLGDRFCETLAGLRWPGRQSLIKLIGRYLSEVSESCSFLSMEQETFQPTYHERVPGSTSGAGQIREVRGFLVVRRQNNQVVRLGRVWT